MLLCWCRTWQPQLCAWPQRDRFHGRWQYLFIESICNDAAVLEQNYRFKMMYSPDYTEQDSEAVRTCAGARLSGTLEFA